MSPVDELNRELKARFPEAEIDVRKADDPNGFQFLNLRLNDIEIAVEWKKDLGFALSAFCA